MGQSMSFYSNARMIFSPLLRLLFGIKRTGQENLPAKGPVIVCCNHRSNYDPVIVGATLSRELKFMAKAELFRFAPLRVLITLLGAFPVERGRGDSGAMGKAAKILESGKVLAMFPEGHRQKEFGMPQRFQSGAARLAFKTHAAILPVAIATRGPVGFFRRNEVRVGRPLSFEELGFDAEGRNLHDVNGLLHDEVQKLLVGEAEVAR